MRSLQLRKSPTPDFDGMCKFESSEVSQAVRHWEKLSPIIAERPANGGLLRIGHQSPGSVFYHLGGENPENLPTHAGLFPFSGDRDRRLVSITTAWPAGSRPLTTISTLIFRAHVRSVHTKAFSSEVDTGSREENASKQKIRARF